MFWVCQLPQCTLVSTMYSKDGRNLRSNSGLLFSSCETSANCLIWGTSPTTLRLTPAQEWKYFLIKHMLRVLKRMH